MVDGSLELVMKVCQLPLVFIVEILNCTYPVFEVCLNNCKICAGDGGKQMGPLGNQESKGIRFIVKTVLRPCVRWRGSRTFVGVGKPH